MAAGPAVAEPPALWLNRRRLMHSTRSSTISRTRRASVVFRLHGRWIQGVNDGELPAHPLLDSSLLGSGVTSGAGRQEQL